MFTGSLHPYQNPGVDLFLSRGNMLAAMGTGTGKTVMAIACAEELLGCGDVETVLIVCPASLKYQWARAISKFTDIPSQKIRAKGKTITVPRSPHGVIIDGKAYQQNGVKYSAQDDRKRQYDRVSDQTDYVIIGYDNVTDDSRQLRKVQPGLVIFDEATAIKNPAAKLTQMTKTILGSDRVEYRMALTATPIENSLEELFFILEWVDEEFLGRWDFFDPAYIKRDGMGVIRGYKNTDVLFEKLPHIMYRKTREDPDVAPYLPEPKTDEWIVQLDPATREVHDVIARDLLEELRSLRPGERFDPAAFYGGQPNESTKPGKAMAMHQAMEMFLDHPALVVRSAAMYEESTLRRMEGEKRKVWPGSKYAYQKVTAGLIKALSSSKIDLLVKSVNTILREDPEAKVIVFSKFKPLLDIIENDMSPWSYRTVQYHGEMSPKAKEGAVAKFEDDPSCRVFLSSHAGAYGRDLFMANHLVNVDQAPSAGRAEQIDGRHVRASSEFPEVWIHNMITERTIEERNRSRLAFKKRVGKAFLDGQGARSGRLDNEVGTLTKFLESLLEDE